MKKMLYIGSDHGGVDLKQELIDFATEQGIKIQNLGTDNRDSVDYPDYAKKVAEKVAGNDNAFGVAICRSGIGVSISANKVKGVRAALVSSEELARLSRQHNNANVLCFGADFIEPGVAKKALLKFVTTEFEGGRHARRVQKMTDLEGQDEI